MAKKIVKRKKLKVFSLLLLLLIVGTISFFLYLYVKSDIKNIIIKGNTYLNDEEVLRLADLTDYPSFILLRTRKTEKKIEKNKYIKSAKVRRKIFHTLEINIKEHEIKIEKAKSSFFEGIDHTGGVLANENAGRVGKKKQKAIINKAKENMKKNKDK